MSCHHYINVFERIVCYIWENKFICFIYLCSMEVYLWYKKWPLFCNLLRIDINVHQSFSQSKLECMQLSCKNIFLSVVSLGEKYIPWLTTDGKIFLHIFLSYTNYWRKNIFTWKLFWWKSFSITYTGILYYFLNIL